MVDSALFVPQRRMHLSAITNLLLQVSKILAKKRVEEVPAVQLGLLHLCLPGNPVQLRVPPAQSGDRDRYLSRDFCVPAERSSTDRDRQGFSGGNRGLDPL